jgi:hypothetical protein
MVVSILTQAAMVSCKRAGCVSCPASVIRTVTASPPVSTSGLFQV